MERLGTAQRIRAAGGRAWRPGRERGAVAIMTVGALIVIIGFFGLAIDLARVFNRRAELQSVADVAALAAARELNGTRSGVTNAVGAAAARFGGMAMTSVTVNYGRTVNWSEAAIEFGPTPNGPWQTASSAQSNPAGLLYARVDTRGLDPSYGEVETFFIRFLSSDLSSFGLHARATAGRSAIRVLPLGVCAMRPEERRNRSGELEEYGFRRGISYDLMQLNPNASTSGQTFLIDPLAAAGGTGGAPISPTVVEPYVCTGTMALPRVTSGQLSVSSPFPLARFAPQLNSRFVNDASVCDPETAPPDANVKAYTFNTSIPWMSTARDGQSAALLAETSRRWTVAGPDPTPTGTTAGSFGPLWSYAKAVQYASTEPASGYTAYGVANWNTLYSPALPRATGYPSNPPYLASSGANFEAPTGTNRGVRHRRVLNLPLLACPVGGSRATVLGIGKFFMTVRADDTHLYAEFAGLVPEQTLNLQMRLYP